MGSRPWNASANTLPDVTLLDMRMPLMSGVEAAIAIRGEFPNARLIALTSYGGDEDVRRALAAGVDAYLTKDVLRKELLDTIRTVNAGRRYIPEALAAALEAQSDGPTLSEREIEVLELVASGLANKQIAYVVKYRGNHRQEPCEEYPAQTWRARSDTRGHGGHSTRNHPSMTSGS